jgi:hypothetical protein
MEAEQVTFTDREREIANALNQGDSESARAFASEEEITAVLDKLRLPGATRVLLGLPPADQIPLSDQARHKGLEPVTRDDVA